MIAKRQEQVREYREVLDRNRKEYEANAAKRLALRGLTEATEPEYDVEEFEFFVREETLPVDS